MTLHSEDEEGVVIFQREDKWKGGNMQIVHILKTEKEQMVKLMKQDLLQKRESSLKKQKKIIFSLLS